MALLLGSNINDILNGTVGNDIIFGFDGDDIIDGGDGDDILIAGNGNDTINGGSGDDIIDGGDGNDILDGGDGNDTLDAGSGDDLFKGSAGNDTFNGGSGSDIADYSQLNTSISLKPTGFLDKGIFGTDQLIKIEKIIANSSVTNNTIDSSTAVGASITVNLQTQSLVVNGVPGVGPFTVVNFDDVKGTNLNDFITGDIQNNLLFGNDGNDIFGFSAGNDTIDGGVGIDTADYSQLNTSISLKPTGVLSKGIFGTDQLVKIEKIIANSSVTNNTIDSSTAVGASITVNLQSKFLGVNGVPGVGPFTVVNFDDVKGTNLNDSITGDSQNNLLFGNDGDDIFGVSAGNDTIDGGVGNDTADYSQLSTSISLKPTGVLSKGIFGTDQLVKIEKIIANSSVTNNTIDSSTAVGASITVNLQTQSLVVNGVPGVGPFTVVNFDDVNGTNLNDSITGDSQNNLLFGNNGDDILNSGAGKDTLIGGQGVDRFDYRNLANSFLSSFDVITDFDATTGNDLFLVSTARTSFFDAGTVATLSSLDIASVLTAANFVANSAAQFTLDYAFGSRTFVAINNSTAGFSANTDAIIEVTGLTGDLGLNNFTTALV